MSIGTPRKGGGHRENGKGKNKQIIEAAHRYMPFLLTIFTFIMLANLLGMVPYIYSVTASLGTALGLSFSI